jgi:hypothetical protein
MSYAIPLKWVVPTADLVKIFAVRGDAVNAVRALRRSCCMCAERGMLVVAGWQSGPSLVAPGLFPHSPCAERH